MQTLQELELKIAAHSVRITAETDRRGRGCSVTATDPTDDRVIERCTAATLEWALRILFQKLDAL